MIEAAHIFKTDRSGQPLRKSFKAADFNSLRPFLRWNNRTNEMENLPNGGWQCLKGCDKVAPPETPPDLDTVPAPLKKAAKKATAKAKDKAAAAKSTTNGND